MNFEEWLEANGLETGICMSPSSIVTRKDNKPAWSKDGHDFQAYSNELIYEAGQKNLFTKEELSRLLLHLGPKSIDHPNEHDNLVNKLRNLLEEK